MRLAQPASGPITALVSNAGNIERGNLEQQKSRRKKVQPLCRFDRLCAISCVSVFLKRRTSRDRFLSKAAQTAVTVNASTTTASIFQQTIPSFRIASNLNQPNNLPAKRRLDTYTLYPHNLTLNAPVTPVAGDTRPAKTSYIRIFSPLLPPSPRTTRTTIHHPNRPPLRGSENSPLPP
jgi:hypothetical protein